MVTCYIGLGSNLGDRQHYINAAIRRIKALMNTRVNKVSSIIETLPEGGLPQGQYLNCVIEAQTTLSPHELLKRLQKIEVDLGRIRTIKNSPRNIDLDILLYGGICINEDTLCIPHPLMHKREFVLKPLQEIAPGLAKKISSIKLIPPTPTSKNKTPRIITSIKDMQKLALELRQQGKNIGFVPTMGALHAGHASLIKKARQDSDVVVVSIFVNPAQFSAGEDLARYPRDLKTDALLCQQEGVDFIFHPDASRIYPQEYKTYITVEKITDGLCGKHRAGHFRGVATIITKLFNVVQPTVAYFGQKDAQQTVIIQQLVKDLDIPVKIKILPIIREPDGLALSSRNKYLTAKEREEAVVLVQALEKAKALIKQGQAHTAKIIFQMRKIIQSKECARIQYIEIVDINKLLPVKKIQGKTLIALAVYIGKTRLIDNIIINAK